MQDALGKLVLAGVFYKRLGETAAHDDRTVQGRIENKTHNGGKQQGVFVHLQVAEVNKLLAYRFAVAHVQAPAAQRSRKPQRAGGFSYMLTGGGHINAFHHSAALC